MGSKSNHTSSKMTGDWASPTVAQTPRTPRDLVRDYNVTVTFNDGTQRTYDGARRTLVDRAADLYVPKTPTAYVNTTVKKTSPVARALAKKIEAKRKSLVERAGETYSAKAPPAAVSKPTPRVVEKPKEKPKTPKKVTNPVTPARKSLVERAAEPRSKAPPVGKEKPQNTRLPQSVTLTPGGVKLGPTPTSAAAAYRSTPDPSRFGWNGGQKSVIGHGQGKQITGTPASLNAAAKAAATGSALVTPAPRQTSNATTDDVESPLPAGGEQRRGRDCANRGNSQWREDSVASVASSEFLELVGPEEKDTQLAHQQVAQESPCVQRVRRIIVVNDYPTAPQGSSLSKSKLEEAEKEYEQSRRRLAEQEVQTELSYDWLVEVVKYQVEILEAICAEKAVNVEDLQRVYHQSCNRLEIVQKRADRSHKRLLAAATKQAALYKGLYLDAKREEQQRGYQQVKRRLEQAQAAVADSYERLQSALYHDALVKRQFAEEDAAKLLQSPGPCDNDSIGNSSPTTTRSRTNSTDSQSEGFETFSVIGDDEIERIFQHSRSQHSSTQPEPDLQDRPEPEPDLQDRPDIDSGYSASRRSSISSTSSIRCRSSLVLTPEDIARILAHPDVVKSAALRDAAKGIHNSTTESSVYTDSPVHSSSDSHASSTRSTLDEEEEPVDEEKEFEQLQVDGKDEYSEDESTKSVQPEVHDREGDPENNKVFGGSIELTVVNDQKPEHNAFPPASRQRDSLISVKKSVSWWDTPTPSGTASSGNSSSRERSERLESALAENPELCQPNRELETKEGWTPPPSEETLKCLEEVQGDPFKIKPSTHGQRRPSLEEFIRIERYFQGPDWVPGQKQYQAEAETPKLSKQNLEAKKEQEFLSPETNIPDTAKPQKGCIYKSEKYSDREPETREYCSRLSDYVLEWVKEGQKPQSAEMASQSYPDDQRRKYNQTPGDVDQDEGGASLMSEIGVPPFGAPELLSPSPFPRLESPKREEDFVTQLHHDDDEEDVYVGRAETTEGDLSLPVEHVRHLLDMDSSFKAAEERYSEEGDSREQTQASSPREEDDELFGEPALEPELEKITKRTFLSTQRTSSGFRKADSSFGQDEDLEDFDDFSMIHPEQTPSLKSRKSFLRNIIVSQANPPGGSNSVSNFNKQKQLGDMPPPPLPPLNRINSRSTQRRLERSHTSDPKPPKSKLTDTASGLLSSDSYEMSSPLPQHQPSSDTEFSPSSPIISAQSRRKLQQSYGGDRKESPAERPPLSNRLTRSESTTSTRSTGRKPKFLKSRQSSTRSSISSAYSNNAYKHDELADDEENEDGGSTVLGAKNEKGAIDKSKEVSPAIEETTTARNGRIESRERDLSEERDGSHDNYDAKGDDENFGGPLSRTTSLGSIASGITGLGQTTSMVVEAPGGPVKLANRNFLDSVTEVKSGVDDDGKDYDSDQANPPLPPETAVGDDTDSDHDSEFEPAKVPLPQESPIEPRTPKNSKPRMPNPSMTAISARVSQIQIPATVAREFYERENRPYPASTRKLNLEQYGKQEAKTPGKDMTLKEQNAVIDKLSKQVFDLKLRCFFLDQKLQNTSEEGMDSLRQENVDLKVQLAGMRKEVKLLRRQVKELKTKASGEDSDGEETEGGRTGGKDMEIIELRERCERYEIEIERLRRKIVVNEAAASAEGVDEVVEIMKEMLENETLKCQQAQNENAMLRRENERLQQELGTQHNSGNLQPPSMTRRTSMTSHSDGLSNAGGSNLATNSRVGIQHGDTAGLMERLRADNDDLRREVGAQTSMLTSRNKERDQLYQEIEELKLNMRSHGTLRPAGSSASMADQLGPRFQHLHHGEFTGTERSASRNSYAGSSTAVLTEEERENMENIHGKLRDKISELKLANGELQVQLQSALRELQEYDMTHEQQLEINSVLRNELREVAQERDAVIRERDQALLEQDATIRERDQALIDFEDLRAEAEEELEKLEMEIVDYKNKEDQYEQLLAQKDEEYQALQEDFEALQREMRKVSDDVIKMEDKVEALKSDAKVLEQEIEVAEKKFREQEQNCERLNVQLESAHGQISFLKEEQDGDKITIGQLETKVKNAEEQIREEKEKARDWERRCNEVRRRNEKERERRSGESEEVKDLERRFNEKEKEIIQKDDDLRRLRKTIAKREGEASQWRNRLEEVEGALREALGDVTGTKENLLESITKLQAQLDTTLEELDATKRRLGEKERTLRDRENLLESMALEAKKLTETLEKERDARKRDKNQVDNLENKHHHTRQKLSQHEIQVKELQLARNREARDTQNLEHKLRDQITERNALLTTLWTRLSTLCGPEWSHRYSHVTTAVAVAGTQQGKLSMEAAVSQAFVGFSRHMINAIKSVENVISGFKTRCKQVERDLWKEYQVIEAALESRTRRLERLETLVRGGLGENAGIRTEIAKLRAENRLLRAEMAKFGGNITGGIGNLTAPPTGKDKRKPVVNPSIERMSQVFDGAGNNTGSSNAASPTAGPSNSNTNIPQVPHTNTNTTTTTTTEKVTKSTTAKARELLTTAFRSSKPPAATATPPPPVNNTNTPASPQSRPTTSTAATNTVIITEPQDDAQGAGGEAGGEGTDPVTQKRWLLRLRELEKRLKSEREARIIDRTGAKRRIEEEREEKELLRKELEREKERWLGVDVPGVEGPKERLSIEDVKRDDQQQQQQQQHQQQAAQASASNTGSMRGREPRERSGSIAGEYKPRRSSRSRHPPVAGPSSESTAGVSRPRAPAPEEQEYRSHSMRERTRSRPPLFRGEESQSQTFEQPRRERGASRHRGANGQEETREERRERKDREREERRVRKEREGSWRGDKRDGREVISPVNSGLGGSQVSGSGL